jgi:hypothetical protein
MSSRDDERTFLKRKTHPAVLPWRKQGDLLRLYFDCYIADEGFAKALVHFSENNRNGIALAGDMPSWVDLKSFRRSRSPDVRQYIDNLQAFATTWKLDCLSWCRGYDAVLHWCYVKYMNPGTPIESFISGAGAGGEVPSVGERVYHTQVLKDPFGNEHESQGFNIELPTIRIAVESTWEARRESPAAIYDRLMRECGEQIVPQLMRWYQEYLAAGYLFQDTETEPGKYASWTYRRIRCEHFKDIAVNECVAAESVRLRTNEFAKAIGLSLPKTRRRVHD